eukprot:Phypoly_transcript_05234.p1 GENE.Phypoly_transcript_05234~~Phypoly_transcript_05234.p1  ORF type:complete len:522 (+),score=55.19 Phypoly_transcript_05234:184-1566(+)
MTLDDAIDHLGFGWFQIRLLFIAGFCWMCESMEMMLLSVISPILKCNWGLSDGILAALTTVIFVGMMCGNIIWGTVSDRWGRRIGFLATSVITFVFGFASAFSPNIYVLLALRFFVGVGVGGGHVAFTLFAEYLPRKQRALCLVLIELFWTVGTMGEAGLGWWLLPRGDWRILLIVSSLPLFVLTLCYWAVPESVRFYQMQNKPQQAMEMLKIVAKANGKELPCASLKVPEQLNIKPASFKDLLAPSLRKTTLLLWVIWFANSFTYYGIVLAGTQIVSERGNGEICNNGKVFPPFFRHDSPTNSSGPAKCEMTSKDYRQVFITSMAEFPGIIITILIIDYVGRKKTQGIEFFICGVFSILLFMCVPDTLQTIFIFVIRGLISGAFQASYVYTPEVYPTAVRSTGLGICGTMARIGGMITPYIAQVVIDKSNYLALGFYAIVNFLACVAAFMLPVETGGRV